MTAFDKSSNLQAISFYINTHPRAERIVSELLSKALVWREEIDQVSGASNGPQEILRLRELGLEIPCRRFLVQDRDGKCTRPGRYYLSSRDRIILARILENIQRGK